MTKAEETAPEPNGQAKADRARKFWGLSVQNLGTIVIALITAGIMYQSLKDSVSAVDVKVDGQSTAMNPVIATVAQHSSDLIKQEGEIKAVQAETDDLKASNGQILSQLNEIGKNVSVLLDRTDPDRGHK